MTVTNKLLLNLLIAALLGIAAAVAQEYVFMMLAKNDISYFFKGVAESFTMVGILFIPVIVAWADRKNYAHFYGIASIFAIIFLLIGIKTTDEIFVMAAYVGFTMTSSLLMGAAFGKFFYAEKEATQVASLAVFIVARSWITISKFIQYRVNHTSETEIETINAATKGLITLVIFAVASLAVWFLKRKKTEVPSVSQDQTEGNKSINGALLYVLLFAFFLFIYVVFHNRNLSLPSDDKDKILTFISKYLNLLWVIGGVAGSFLCLKLDRFVVLMSCVLAYLACTIAHNYVSGNAVTYLNFAGMLFSGGLFAALLLWAMKALPFNILATFIVVESLLYKVVGFLMGKGFDFEHLFTSDFVKQINIFIALLSAGAFVLFYFNREKLYRNRYIDDCRELDETTQTWTDQIAVPAFATSSQRIGAAVLDVIFIMLISLLVSFFIPYRMSELSTIFTLIIQIIYYLGFEAKSGSTFGKKIMGITVIDRSCNTPDLGHAILRMLCRFIPLSGFTVFFGGEALHDRLSKTYVVNVKDYYHVIGTVEPEPLREDLD
jgi:uncharacterized RDD family membrane protein YckC